MAESEQDRMLRQQREWQASQIKPGPKWWHWALGLVGLAAVLGAILPEPPPMPEGSAPYSAVKPAAVPAIPEIRAMPGLNNFAMIIPPAADPAKLPLQAKQHCGEEAVCSVFGWASEFDAARAFPMTDREAAAMLFSYGINRKTGHERVLWNCERYPRADKAECL